MPLIGPAHDPETLVMLCRALDAAFRQTVPDPIILNEADHRAVRARLARALVRAYDDGERDLDLLTILAVHSCGPQP
jgi:hypothetical protein